MVDLYKRVKSRVKKHRSYAASFTVEAAMVLSVVFFTFGALIRYAFVWHDTVTGTMILSEMLDIARYRDDEKMELQELEERGTGMGNPRLWLGAYSVSMQEGSDGIAGAAAAGEWGIRIDVKKSRPAEFLRGIAAVEEIGGFFNDGSGIQEGNESELPDTEAGDYAE